MRIGCGWLLAAAVALGAPGQAWAGPIAINDGKQQQASSSSSSSSKAGCAGLHVLTSMGGQLSVDLTVAPWEQPGVAAPPAALFHAGEVSRAPPVLRAYPGDTIQVRVRSELPNHVKRGRDEATGLALHGLRLDTSPSAAPEGSGGILSRLAGPKLAIHTFTLSENHAPGLHWYRVGSDKEEGPGFRGAFYVLPRGEQGGVSAAAAEGTGSKHVIQQDSSGSVARLLLLQYDAEAGAYLVNGEEGQQALSVRAGEAQVLDLAHAGGPHLLEVEVEGEGNCSLRLLALDGVPVPSDDGAPREVSYVGLAALQRARVLLACQSAGQAALVSRPAATRNVGLSQSARWEQRLLAVSVSKGLGQLLPFNRRLPVLPVRPRAAASHGMQQQRQHGRPWYLRDLSDAIAPVQTATCALTLVCPAADSCPAGRLACSNQGQRQLSSDAGTSNSLRELTVTLTHPMPPAAAVRLVPARPFQILDFVPATAAGQEGQDNPYLQHWGQFGDWRDVLPPLAGTFRLRYRASGGHAQAPELQYDGFDGFVEQDAAVSTSSKPHRAMTSTVAAAAAAAEPAIQYRAYSSSSEHAHQQPSQQLQPGYEPAWALPIPGRTKKGKLSGMDGKDGSAAEAYLVVQAVVAEEKRNATWVEEALRGYLRPYLSKKKNEPAEATVAEATEGTEEAAAQNRRRLLAATHVAIPFQMPRRFLPAGDRCNDSALLWPVHFTLHLANASAVYPVINKLHALLVRQPEPQQQQQQQQHQHQAEQQAELPRLCSVNVTLLNSGFSAAADGRTAAAPATAAMAGSEEGGSTGAGAAVSAKVPPKVVLMLAFAGGACLILLGFFAYRHLAHAAAGSSAGGGRHRGSRRSSVQHFHDPTTIEQQITELDDSLSSTTLGVKSSALRHNSRSRNNSMTGLSAHAVVFPPPRLPSHGHAHGHGHAAAAHRLSGSISISGSGGSSSAGADLSGSSSPATGGGGPGGATAATATTVGSIAHFRSSSSLPTDLDPQESHGRSASLPHNGFGFFLPRRSSFHNSNNNNEGARQGGGSK